jgi:hypothetical protein
MIRHDNKCAEVDAFVFHAESECRDNDSTCFCIKNRLPWM